MIPLLILMNMSVMFLFLLKKISDGKDILSTPPFKFEGSEETPNLEWIELWSGLDYDLVNISSNWEERDKIETNRSIQKLLLNKMTIQIDMLCSLMKQRVTCDV